MAGYGTVIAFAEELGQSGHVDLLNETLEEEKATDEKLTELSSDVNAKANKGAEGAGEEDEPGAGSGAKKKSRNAA
jgi:ferritin-like metal-binding protein YciE